MTRALLGCLQRTTKASSSRILLSTTRSLCARPRLHSRRWARSAASPVDPRVSRRFDIVVSSAWWAVQKHGETQVWVGNRLVRLNAEDKHLKRQRYADSIEALGCDVSRRPR